MNKEEIFEYFKPVLNQKEMHELSTWVISNEYKKYKLFKTKNNFKIKREPRCRMIVYYVFFGEHYCRDGKFIEFVTDM